MFSVKGNSVAWKWMLYDVSGYRKFKMAVGKPEIPVSSLVDKIDTKFQRHVTGFRDGELSGMEEDVVRYERK